MNGSDLKLLWFYSTGTGRTGTYIALDYLYKTGKKSGSVNVAQYVKTMRENRMNMVDTLVSILFIVNKLGAFIYFGKSFYI